ncbi:methylaspartate ammonia-lyase [Hydrogenispora ethanolica]|uniref:methylaspartate ammonia-lyase n=1 Tax=Hydrogenispora ethanolica TaxID=1082276 RepID=A0A4R1R9P9_HYDET|nr:methylaspartate ammonia-lyase [Hydrogenispora ethanolica]TCL62454.1 methylaspartate ammonia-lyase [Hydrogenispora ethanolica]
MRIAKMICAPGRTGFFFDDQLAIKRGAEPDGAAYRGEPLLPGFTSVRQAGEAISVLLVMEDGRIAHGDCAAVQYSGAGGRDPVFLANEFIPIVEQVVGPRLVGRELNGFRGLAEELDRLVDPASGKPLHTAIRYGVTQAVLDAAAQAANRLMVDLVAAEYGTEPVSEPIPIFSQSGDDRYANADKMILKGADVLPHGLINNVPAKLGRRGELLLEYVGWLRERIERLKPRPDYRPVLHLDVYGTIGLAFENDQGRILDYLARLAAAAAPLSLRIEGPVDMGGRQAQAEALAGLRQALDSRGIPVAIVADEWCNTLEDIQLFADARAGHMIQIKTPDLGGINNCIEAVLYCKSQAIGAYLGGTCNETDRSAQICVHLALATGPDQILAKPGMGVDEGYMIVYNEMRRVLALREALR